ncbi:MAG: hypothetical protein D6707_07540 [Bacteroidetes bacterium]|nr:MAG: hypothetical protein D6707_07540 [Bacteroidota bacterium]
MKLLLNKKEASERLFGYNDHKKLTALLRSGELRSIIVGGTEYIPTKELENFIENKLRGQYENVRTF